MIGRGMYTHCAVQLLLELSLTVHPSDIPATHFLKDMEHLVVQLLLHERYEVVSVTLSFLEALMNKGEYLEDTEVSTLPVKENFCSRVKEWDRCHDGAMADALRSSPAVGEILVRQVMLKDYYTFAECRKTFCVLSHFPKALLRVETGAEGVLRSLLQQCREEHEGIGWTMLKCAGALMKSMQLENVSCENQISYCLV
jgi:hypothetical protein